MDSPLFPTVLSLITLIAGRTAGRLWNHGTRLGTFASIVVGGSIPLAWIAWLGIPWVVAAPLAVGALVWVWILSLPG